MAGTLADMKARIASETKRDDITDDIANAITDAISICQKVRLRFNETDQAAPPTFQTVAGQWVYGAAADTNIPNIQAIDFVRALVGNTWQPMSRYPVDQITAWNEDGDNRGQPVFYAYGGNKLLISAIPDQVYTVKFSGHLTVAAPAADDEVGNVWMTSAEMLIRSYAKYLIALHVTRNPTMQQAMSPQPPADGIEVGHAAYWALQALKGEGNRVAARGIVAPMQF